MKCTKRNGCSHSSMNQDFSLAFESLIKGSGATYRLSPFSFDLMQKPSEASSFNKKSVEQRIHLSVHLWVCLIYSFKQLMKPVDKLCQTRPICQTIKSTH